MRFFKTHTGCERSTFPTSVRRLKVWGALGDSLLQSYRSKKKTSPDFKLCCQLLIIFFARTLPPQMCYSYLLSLNSSNFSLISTIKCRGTKFEGGDVPSLVPQLINIGIELFSLFPMIISRGTHAHRESYIPSESSRDVSIV